MKTKDTWFQNLFREEKGDSTCGKSYGIEVMSVTEGWHESLLCGCKSSIAGY